MSVELFREKDGGGSIDAMTSTNCIIILIESWSEIQGSSSIKMIDLSYGPCYQCKQCNEVALELGLPHTRT